MAQPLEAAGDEPVADATDPTAALENLLAAEDAPEDEAGEAEAEEEELELEDEPEAAPEKASDAPVSLNADEKARYAQLPPEAQQFVAELEARRNTQVQTATTKASEAQRAAEARAAQADAQARQTYADQLNQFADALAPQAPDPALAQTDPMQYIAQRAQFDAAKAQHDQFVQQVQAIKSEATQGVSQSFVQERDRQLLTIPDVQNEATRDAFFAKTFEAAELLGFDREAVTTKATAQEITMLRAVADLKAKADKYDAAMSRQMKTVRNGKTRTITPGAAQVRQTSAEGDALVKQFDQRPSRETAAAMIEKYL
jgi:hypothetical protein